MRVLDDSGGDASFGVKVREGRERGSMREGEAKD